MVFDRAIRQEVCHAFKIFVPDRRGVDWWMGRKGVLRGGFVMDILQERETRLR